MCDAGCDAGPLSSIVHVWANFLASGWFVHCYFLSCYFFSYLPTVSFFPVALFILLPKWTVTFFPVSFFPTCPLLLSFLLLFFPPETVTFFPVSFFPTCPLLLSFLLLFFLLLFFLPETVTFFPVTFFPVTFFPCTSSCRVSDQGTTLRASDLHNAQATILNPFIKMWFHFFMLFTLCAIVLYETGPIQWMFSQHCGYWWPGALAPGHQ